MKISGVIVKPRMKVVAIQRDVATETGDVAYTGLGFSPRVVIAISAISASKPMSVGIFDAGAKGIVYNSDAGLADSFGFSTSYTIVAEIGGGAFCTGVIKTLDADGFTITWTKTGSPTGTLDALCLALE